MHKNKFANSVAVDRGIRIGIKAIGSHQLANGRAGESPNFLDPGTVLNGLAWWVIRYPPILQSRSFYQESELVSLTWTQEYPGPQVPKYPIRRQPMLDPFARKNWSRMVSNTIAIFSVSWCTIILMLSFTHRQSHIISDVHPHKNLLMYLFDE